MNIKDIFKKFTDIGNNVDANVGYATDDVTAANFNNANTAAAQTQQTVDSIKRSTSSILGGAPKLSLGGKTFGAAPTITSPTKQTAPIIPPKSTSSKKPVTTTSKVDPAEKPKLALKRNSDKDKKDVKIPEIKAFGAGDTKFTPDEPFKPLAPVGYYGAGSATQDLVTGDKKGAKSYSAGANKGNSDSSAYFSAKRPEVHGAEPIVAGIKPNAGGTEDMLFPTAEANDAYAPKQLPVQQEEIGNPELTALENERADLVKQAAEYSMYGPEYADKVQELTGQINDLDAQIAELKGQTEGNTNPSMNSQFFGGGEYEMNDMEAAQAEFDAAFDEAYGALMDDPYHAQMLQNMKNYTYKVAGGADLDLTKDFREEYTAAHDAFEKEREMVVEQYGEASPELKAFDKFMQEYEDLGRAIEVKEARKTSARYSSALDENLLAIYGGLMETDEYQAAIEKGRKALSKMQGGATRFDREFGRASELQQEFLLYLLGTGGFDAIEQFRASEIGQLLTASIAGNIYADQIENDSSLWRGFAIGGNTAFTGMEHTFSGAEAFYKGLTGKDQDDPTDMDLGGGYTISDATDHYLKQTLIGDMESDQFNMFSELGSSALATAASGSDWYKTFSKDASEYQKKAMGLLYYAFTSEYGSYRMAPADALAAVQEMWSGVEEYKQALWDSVKKGSHRVPVSGNEMLYSLYDEYLRLGDTELGGFFNKLSNGEVGAAQMLHQAGMTMSEQIIPMLMSMGVGGALRALGAGKKTVSWMSRLASGIPMAMSIGGRSYNEAVENGADRAHALGYGITDAALEFVVGWFLDGAGNAAGKFTGGLRDRLIAKIASPLGRALADAGIRSFGEGLEEYIQEALAPVVDLWLNDKSFMDALNEVAFGEGNVPDDILEGLEMMVDNLADPDRLYAGFLGAFSALAMSPGNVATDIRNNAYYQAYGDAMKKADGLKKAADLILHNKPSGSDVDSEAYEAAKSTAEIIDKGGNVSDLAAGKMVADFAASGGDASMLANPATLSYTKESITEDDYAVGVASELLTLGEESSEATMEMAKDIAKLATGQEISEEAQARIDANPNAQKVLEQINGELDMSDNNNALTRAARMSVISGYYSKLSEAVQQFNKDKTIVTPAVKSLIDSGIDVKEAQSIGAVINKVLDGQTLTEKEAKLINAKSAAVRSTILATTGLNLTEYATPKMVMEALNGFAKDVVRLKDSQAAVKKDYKRAAQARGAAMQGGLQNGLGQTDTGGPGGVSTAQPSAGLQGQVPGGSQGADGSVQEGRGTAAHRGGLQQRSEAGARANEEARVIPVDELTEDQKKLRELLISRGFEAVEFVVGENSESVWDPDKQKYLVRIRVGGQFEITQYADHETLHLWLTALKAEYRETVVRSAAQAIFGEDFSKAYEFVKDLYTENEYLEGLSAREVLARVCEDMLCFANGNQVFGKYFFKTLNKHTDGFDFSKYHEAVQNWVKEIDLEAIGTGDFTNPAVQEALNNGQLNQTYYDRHGWSQEDDGTTIDISMPDVETEQAQPEQTEEEKARERIMDTMRLEALQKMRKNLAKQRKQLVDRARTTGDNKKDSPNYEVHRAKVDALDEQLKMYDKRIAELESKLDTRHSADYEEETNGETLDQGAGAAARRVAENSRGESTQGKNGQDNGRSKGQGKKQSGAQKAVSDIMLRVANAGIRQGAIEKIEKEGGYVVEEKDVPEEFAGVTRLINALAPGAELTYYVGPAATSGFMSFDENRLDGIHQGGIFINLAALESPKYSHLDLKHVTPRHESAHFLLYTAPDYNGDIDSATSDLLNYLLDELDVRDPRGKAVDLVQNKLNKICSRYTGETKYRQVEETLVDLFAGAKEAFENNEDERVLVQSILREWFVDNTNYNEEIDEDYGAQYSADYDPEYYQSIGLIDTDGSTAAFTDNIGGVHEDIINQLNGHPGEDVKDFIARGGVRVKPNSGIEINGNIAPTSTQYDMIENIVANFSGDAFGVDFVIDGAYMGTELFEGADIDPNRVRTFLRKYYERRKAGKVRDEKLERFGKILGMPVKTMEDAYNLAQMMIQMEGPDPELQEIVDTYMSGRYSADYLDPNSNDYIGPDLDASVYENAKENEAYSKDNAFWINGGEVAAEEELFESSLDDDILDAGIDAFLARIAAEKEAGNLTEEQMTAYWDQYAEKQQELIEYTPEAPKPKPKKKGKPKATSSAKPAPEKTEAPKPVIPPANKAEPEAPKPAQTSPEKSELAELAEKIAAQPEDNPDPELLAQAVEAMNRGEAEYAKNLERTELATQEIVQASEELKKTEAEIETKEQELAKQEKKPVIPPAEKSKPKHDAIVLKNDGTKFSKKDKSLNYVRKIGKASSIEIRRRRSDRNTFDVRFNDGTGKIVAYEGVSPSALIKAFAYATGDKETAKQRAGQAMALASEPSLTWSVVKNEKIEKAPYVKPEEVRDRDNYGRLVPVKLTEFLKNSAIRTDKGALINVYRLAPANGVHNNKLNNKLSIYTERAAPINTMRGVTGAAAFGQTGKGISEQLAEWLRMAADPEISPKELEKIRQRIVATEALMREYTNGVTRLDSNRPGFEFATPENAVNGKTLVEAYLDIRKPKVIDAKGKGVDFIRAEVQKFIRDPANKAGLFDANKNPVGPHDGFKFLNVRVLPEGETLGGGEADLDTAYVTLRNNQAKSTYNTAPTDSDFIQYSADYADVDTGYTEGTLEDTILKIMMDKDEDRALAALAEYFSTFLQTGVLPQMEDEKTQNIFQPRVSTSQRQILEERLRQDIDRYGRLEPGENPARNVFFPKRTDEGYVPRTYRTSAEAENIPERTVPAIMREIVQNGTKGKTVVYQRITDKEAIAFADREMQKRGFNALLTEWQGKRDNEKQATKHDIAVAELVMIEAAKAGDVETTLSVMAELAEAATTAGQVVQAMRLIKSMPASYQLYYFQRVVNRLNRQYSKMINSKKMDEIKIDRDKARAVINAKTQEDLDTAVENLLQSVADQIPSTAKDKWNAWRYLAMLGNPKTHIRNLFGNAIFAPAKFAKNLIAAGLEGTIIKDPTKRNTSIKGLLGAPSEYRTLAQQDYEGIKKDLQAGGKYNPMNEVMQKRRIFSDKTALGRAVEWLSKKNGDLLEWEDGQFLKRHYINALTNFLATRGLSVATLQSTPEGARVMNEARQFAFNEALKATYRDASAIASALNNIKKSSGAAGVLLDGVLPFTKTPINILKRGLEYSPVGLLNAITVNGVKLKNGDIDVHQFIDTLSAGLTGTGVALIGYLLSSLGLLHGSDDDDEKKADADKLVGYQNYSIDIGGKNFTIDWAAPTALPLFVGNAIFNELGESNELSFNDVLNAITVIAEPLTQLSMLSGLNDAMKSAKWDENPLSSVAMSAASGYASQALPTFFAQIARSIPKDRRTTYVDKNSDVSPAIQRWMQTNILGKTPGLNNMRTEYVDAWGRKDTDKNGFIRRLFANMFAPWYTNNVNITAVDSELQRLSETTGSSVLMSPAERYIEFNNQKHNLTADQYKTYSTVRGEQTFSMLSELFNSYAYQNSMTEEEKAKAVGFIKQYGNILGKQAVFPEYAPDEDNWAEKCDGDTSRMLTMALVKAQASEAGITVSNNGAFYNMVVNSSWMSPVDKAYAIAQQYDIGTTKEVYVTKKGPHYELTPERKNTLFEHYRMIFPGYYLELVQTQAWQNADTEKRLEMLADLRKQVNGINKAWLAEYLYSIGATQITG